MQSCVLQALLLESRGNCGAGTINRAGVITLTSLELQRPFGTTGQVRQVAGGTTRDSKWWSAWTRGASGAGGHASQQRGQHVPQPDSHNLQDWGATMGWGHTTQMKKKKGLHIIYLHFLKEMVTYCILSYHPIRASSSPPQWNTVLIFEFICHLQVGIISSVLYFQVSGYIFKLVFIRNSWSLNPVLFAVSKSLTEGLYSPIFIKTIFPEIFCS